MEQVEISLPLNKTNLEIDKITFQKMAFIYNAVNSGWTIKKTNKVYVFTQNHEGKKKEFDDGYLEKFIRENANVSNILG